MGDDGGQEGGRGQARGAGRGEGEDELGDGGLGFQRVEGVRPVGQIGVYC